MTVKIDQPMLARRQFRLAVMMALQGLSVTLASPGNWPTPGDKLPALLVNVPTENKVSSGRNVPEFTTTASLVIQGQVTGATPEAAQDSLDALCYLVENAVLTDYWVNNMIQQFVSIQTETEITSEGSHHLAGFRMTIGAEMFEAFDPLLIAPAASAWPPAKPVNVALAGIDLHADMLNVFDPSGTYANPTFPSSVQPAPRTTGPDGRDEGALQNNLPQ
jgi:hypothetical protein